MYQSKCSCLSQQISSVFREEMKSEQAFDGGVRSPKRNVSTDLGLDAVSPPLPLGSDVSLLVHFAGTGFPRDAQFLQVTVNKASCEVIFSKETNVACELALLPVGVYRIFMLVRPLGLAVNASGEGLFLYVEPRLDAVEPSTAAEIGNVGGATLRTYPPKLEFLLIGRNLGPQQDEFHMYCDFAQSERPYPSLSGELLA